MTKVRVDISRNPITTVREFVDKYQSKDMIPPTFNTTTYTNALQQSRQYLPTSCISSTSDWENFKNELEFE